jgi:hypothetical protein
LFYLFYFIFLFPQRYSINYLHKMLQKYLNNIVLLPKHLSLFLQYFIYYLYFILFCFNFKNFNCIYLHYFYFHPYFYCSRYHFQIIFFHQSNFIYQTIFHLQTLLSFQMECQQTYKLLSLTSDLQMHQLNVQIIQENNLVFL